MVAKNFDLTKSAFGRKKWKTTNIGGEGLSVEKLETYKKCDENNAYNDINSSKTESERVSYLELFKYSTITERVLIVVSIILATIGAFGVPFSVVIYGEFTTLLIDRTVAIGKSTPANVLNWFGGGKILTNATREENNDALIEDSKAFVIASFAGGLATVLVLAIGVDLMNFVAAKQIARIRKLFLDAILRQDMTWYDITRGYNFAAKLTEDLDKLKEGIGEKLAIFSFLILSFVTCVIAALLFGWKLALAVLVCCPVIILSTAMVAKIQASLTEKELKAYSIAGAVAEEVFGGIRTVVAFSGESKETKRYAERLQPAEVTGRKKGLYSGIGGGLMWFVIYCCYAVALWYGVQLILDDRDKEVKEYTPAVLVIVLFGVILGAMNLGFSSPHVEAFSSARAAAKTVFSIINRKSPIDPMNEKGLKPNDVLGNIEFKGISFRYPARSHIEILKGLNLTVKAGQTVAFVGPSGCGKSTCIQLFQRLYDPDEGSIKLDGININETNVAWLRSQIGVVGQEPVLFATTIGENIKYGKPTATQEEIENAAKMANCHDFICKLPNRYDTVVGERGTQMSGGQKQRIAIARALVRNPKILLLDEATSALDPTSERRVQDALEIASKNRTTLVVSHRLSAVTNADKIVFIKDGVVAEEGNHEQLMARKGLYYKLVKITKQKEESEKLTEQDRKEAPMEKVELVEDEDNEIGDINESPVVPDKYKVSLFRLMKLNAPEWKYILVGCIAAILHGATFPAWAVFFGEFYGVLSDPDDSYVKSKANTLSIIFIVIGVIAGLGTLFQTFLFNIAGVKLTSRLRQTAFKTIVSQEMGWFDEKKNSVGALCARLAGDCSSVQGATGSRVGIIVQSISTLLVGTIISLVYSWSLTLVTLITVPLVLGAIFFESRYMAASAYAEKHAIESASQIAVEAITNIRTVTSLGQEPHVFQRYCQQIDSVTAASRKKTRFRGTVFGFGQAAPMIAYGVCLSYGGLLVATEGLHYQNIIKVSEALIFGAWMLGQALAYAPNVNAAIISAGRLLRLFERIPKIHNPQSQPFNTAEKADGDIDFENVQFRYPTRQEVPVLQGLNLKIEKGTTVALVGPSGCGKSTCIQLILRYYDPDSGCVNLGGVKTTEFPFDTLRSQLGLVSQEPVLFDKTIAENIAYGNNFRDDIPMTEIIDAAKKSNIHEFISSLPQGYDTSLGNKGAQLSGGQKQRIAIARALVRDPKILILDEATSALDMQSEKVVQDALDSARAGRTCITIAHRLTTIRNADVICVIKNGVVHEKGTHDKLFRLNGIYAELYRMQQVT